MMLCEKFSEETSGETNRCFLYPLIGVGNMETFASFGVPLSRAQGRAVGGKKIGKEK
jgi:hypothetical protein